MTDASFRFNIKKSLRWSGAAASVTVTDTLGALIAIRDRAGNAIGNPLTATAAGMIHFFAEADCYTLHVRTGDTVREVVAIMTEPPLPPITTIFASMIATDDDDVATITGTINGIEASMVATDDDDVATITGTISSSLWTPADITTSIWFDAADAATIAEDTTPGRVSQWDDKSGNARHAVGSGGNSPFTGDTTLNSLNVLRGASSQYMTFDYEHAGIVSFAYVVNINSASNGVIQMGTVNTNMASSRNSTQIQVISQISPFDDRTLNNSPPSLSTPFMVSVAAADGADMDAWTNGTIFDDIQANCHLDSIVTPSTSHLFALANSTWNINGYIAEIFASNSLWSTSDRQKAEGYLAWKWGLEGDLPIGHPYKSAPP